MRSLNMNMKNGTVGLNERELGLDKFARDR